MPERSYKAKILLFGEYTIILGGQALATPVTLFHGYWDYVRDQNPDSLKAQDDLNAFAHFLDQLCQNAELLSDLDTKALLNELKRGLFFNSTIPYGYGAGSSGALCAAIYDHFSRTKIMQRTPEALAKLKAELAQIEQYFHGSSSGIDPLVSYLDEAILIEPEQIRITKPPSSGTEKPSLFLLDTGRSRKTAPLVNLFLKKCKKEDYKNQCIEVLGPLNKAAIYAFLDNETNDLYTLMAQISQFQFQHFREMIPKTFHDIWDRGLSSELYKLKLCGAGGGGFILGITRDLEAMKSEIPGIGVFPVFSI